MVTSATLAELSKIPGDLPRTSASVDDPELSRRFGTLSLLSSIDNLSATLFLYSHPYKP